MSSGRLTIVVGGKTLTIDGEVELEECKMVTTSIDAVISARLYREFRAMQPPFEWQYSGVNFYKCTIIKSTVMPDNMVSVKMESEITEMDNRRLREGGI